MAYKYLTTARINSTIKKHNLELAYTKGAGYFYFLDLTTGDQVGESVMVAKMHHFTIQQWRDAAATARESAPLTPTGEGTTKEVAKKMREDAAKVREIVETWDDAVEATREELAQKRA